jgi:hypothetical protein
MKSFSGYDANKTCFSIEGFEGIYQIADQNMFYTVYGAIKNQNGEFFLSDFITPFQDMVTEYA